MIKKGIIKATAFILLSVMSFLIVGCNTEKEIEARSVYDYSTGIDFSAQPYELVNRKVAEYVILIPSDADSRILSIANELNEYVNKCGGAYLDIKADASYTESNYISIGKTKQFTAAGLSASSVKSDGFMIKSVGNSVYIMSENERGLSYGVYSFIERFFGVRWLTDLYTHIPVCDVLSFYPCDIVEEPVFEMRTWYGGAAYLTSEFWDKCRYYEGVDADWYNGDDNPYFGAKTHNITDTTERPGSGYVNKNDIDEATGKELGEAHPEYWSDYTNPTTLYDACYTNGIDDNGNLREGQSFASLVIKRIKNALENDKEGKKYKYFMIGHMDDRNAICKCETCVARRAEYDDSGICVVFMNCIEREVNTWLKQTQNRTVTFMTFAYQFTQYPPVEKQNDGSFKPKSELVKVNDNIWIRMALIDADYTYSFSDSKQLSDQKDILYGWAALSKNLAIWDYQSNYIEYFWYFPTLKILKDNLEEYKRVGVKYVLNQSSYSQNQIWFDDIKNYVSSKLYWNLGWDVEYLVNEYLDLYYQEAANDVKDIIAMFDNYYLEQQNNGSDEQFLTLLSQNGRLLRADTFPIAFLESIIKKIDDEEEKIDKLDKEDLYKKNLIKKLQAIRITPMTMILRNYSSYYSPETETAYAQQYFDLLDSFGIKAVGEHLENYVSERKKTYGIG